MAAIQRASLAGAPSCGGCLRTFADETSLRRHVRERCIPITHEVVSSPNPTPFRATNETDALLKHASRRGTLVKRRLTGVLPAAGISAVQKCVLWLVHPMGWPTYSFENCRLVSLPNQAPRIARSPRTVDVFIDQLCQVLASAVSHDLLLDPQLGVVSHRMLLRLDVLRRVVVMLDALRTTQRPARPIAASSRYALVVSLWKFLHFLRATTASNRRHELDTAASFLGATKLRMGVERQIERKAREREATVSDAALSVVQLRDLSKKLAEELRGPPRPKTVGGCVRFAACLMLSFFVYWMPPRQQTIASLSLRELAEDPAPSERFTLRRTPTGGFCLALLAGDNASNKTRKADIRHVPPFLCRSLQIYLTHVRPLLAIGPPTSRVFVSRSAARRPVGCFFFFSVWF